jgi:hypothetical protein
LWRRSRTCFPKLFLSPMAHYCVCSYKEHLNNNCLHNIGAIVFHMYKVIRGCRKANTQKYNIISTYYNIRNCTCLILKTNVSLLNLTYFLLFNPPLAAILYHLRSVTLSLTDTQFLIPITFIPLKLGCSPFALTFLGI